MTTAETEREVSVAANDIRGAGDIIPAERQQRLREWFSSNVSGSVQELARMFNTSISTIRRDLDILASEGILRRTHGGAVSVRKRSAFEPSAELARRTAVEEKRAIAFEAARRLEAGQSILLDTGSTPFEFARVIAKMSIQLTVVTQDLQIAGVLAMRPHIRLIVPGGVCRPNAYTLLGEPGEHFLESLRCDYCFLTGQAMDEECLSDTFMELVRLKKAMVRSARQVCVLLDSSRMSSRAIYRVIGIEEIDEIITDIGFPDEHILHYEEAGVNVTRAVPNDSSDDEAGQK